MPLKILVCLDGELHSQGAMEWAMRLAMSQKANLTALHVIDPHLKTFVNELYSQGRKDYLDHVDRSLLGNAEQIRHEFAERCATEALDYSFKVLHGEPLEEILAELRRSHQDLVITGGKTLGAWGRFRSRNLPILLAKRVATPILIVRSEQALRDL